jgi:hypothetical protein
MCGMESIGATESFLPRLGLWFIFGATILTAGGSRHFTKCRKYDGNFCHVTNLIDLMHACGSRYSRVKRMLMYLSSCNIPEFFRNVSYAKM